MSAHARLMDAVSEVTGERAVDAVFVIRRRALHWPLTILGTVVGAALGLLVPTAPWFFSPSFAIIGLGLGMNAGTDFRLVARTHSRAVLLAASRVNARPVGVIRPIVADDVAVTTRPVWVNLVIAGEPHVMGRHHLTRLRRMLGRDEAADFG